MTQLHIFVIINPEPFFGDYILTKDFKTKEIKGTKTVAQRLKSARKKLEFNLEDAEKTTNIRLKYLEAFENGNFAVFPSEVYALGFLRRYCDFLNLNVEAIATQYKIERNAANSLIPEQKKDSFSPQSSAPRFDISITPKTLAIIAVTIIVASLLVYIWWSVQKFSAPPKLIITKPTSNQVVTDDKLLIAGNTDPGTYVFINNETVSVNQKGQFSMEVNLDQNTSTLQIIAKNRLDRQTIHVIKVIDEKK